MRILLDTHILLWWLADDQRLPRPIRAAVADGRNSVYVSAISVAEIAIKGSLGKLQSPGDLATAIVGSGLSHLPFTAETRGPPERASVAPSRSLRSHADRAGRGRVDDLRVSRSRVRFL